MTTPEERITNAWRVLANARELFERDPTAENEADCKRREAYLNFLLDTYDRTPVTTTRGTT